MIRPACVGDLDALVELDAALFGVEGWSRASFLGSLTSTIVDVRPQAGPAGGDDPTLVGLGLPRRPARPTPPDGYAVLSVAAETADLQRIGVRREHRRMGLATGLLDAALDLARSCGAERVLLEVGAANAGARSFYAAAGFVEIARRVGYYRDGTDALVLERPVTP